MEKAIIKKSGGRPVFLHVLCALSIISNIFSISISSLLLIGGKAASFPESIPVLDIIAEELKHGSILFYFIKIAIHLFCIFAVVLIAKKLRKGLLFYALSQLILLGIPWFFLASLGRYYLLMITIISMIFALFFMMLFGLAIPKKIKPTA